MLKIESHFFQYCQLAKNHPKSHFPLHKNVSLCNFLNSSLLTIMALSKFQRLTSADIIVFCHPIIQLNIVSRAGFVLNGHSCNMNRKRCEMQYFSNPFHTATFTILHKFLKKKQAEEFLKNVAKMFIKIQMDFEARFTFQICHQH